MKTKTIAILFTVAALFIGGCATPTLTQTRTPVVNTVQTPVVTTTQTPATVVSPQGVTNTVFLFNTTTNYVETTTTNYVVSTVTNYAPNATATQIAGTVQSIAPFVPAPYSSPLEAGGYLLALIAGGVAAYKNAKANQHLNTLQAVVAGVETALPNVMTATGNNPSIAQAAISAIKQSITGATLANNTQGNLSQVISDAALS